MASSARIWWATERRAVRGQVLLMKTFLSIFKKNGGHSKNTSIALFRLFGGILVFGMHAMVLKASISGITHVLIDTQVAGMTHVSTIL